MKMNEIGDKLEEAGCKFIQEKLERVRKRRLRFFRWLGIRNCLRKYKILRERLDR
jgi:hypothetical protein